MNMLTRYFPSLDQRTTLTDPECDVKVDNIDSLTSSGDPSNATVLHNLTCESKNIRHKLIYTHLKLLHMQNTSTTSSQSIAIWLKVNTIN